jgi:hypothetical protein
MKTLTKISFCAIFIACVFFIFYSCSKKDKPGQLLKGKLKLSVGVSVVVNDVSSKLKSDCDNFMVKVFDKNNEVVASYMHASDIPDPMELPEGEYYVIASSAESCQSAIFEDPFYQGKSDNFTITAGQTSSVGITCTLANIMATVVYSSHVTSSFTDYSTTVSNTTANLVFTKNEARAGYFDAGPLHIEATLTYMVGAETKTKAVTGDIASAQAGKHYEIHIDASPTSGSSSLGISMNENIVKEIVNITGNSGTPTTGDVGYGDLLISEIMYDPKTVGDNYGEWIEVYNNSVKTINLKGLVLRRGGETAFHQISSDVNMPAGAYFVLGRSPLATANVKYVYDSFMLVNADNELIIATYGTSGLDGTIICSVKYGPSVSLNSPAGKSLQLDPTVKDANAAKLSENWCVSTKGYSTGDVGTPGLANSSCY